ncbi:MAG: hypothetical protein JWP89_2814 [Schlesneria sp.]|nr:hypothetical protein [Schlesneria sp.]
MERTARLPAGLQTAEARQEDHIVRAKSNTPRASPALPESKIDRPLRFWSMTKQGEKMREFAENPLFLS